MNNLCALRRLIKINGIPLPWRALFQEYKNLDKIKTDKNIKLHIVTDNKATERENDKERLKPNAQLIDWGTHRRRSLKHNSHNMVNR